jgi:CDP-glucose 4,6-dehydratase
LASQDLSFYRGKRIFLTGHTGFKGGWLASWLNKLGATVHGFSQSPGTEPSFFVSAHIEEQIESEIGDIRDLSGLKRSMKKFEPDLVFHLAAQPLVRLSYERPVETFETNVMGTVNVLEALRECPGTKACVMITSDKCYQNNEWVYSYRENDPMGGHDPYSASKGAAEIVIGSYRSAFFAKAAKEGIGCGVASARAGNVIGGGDWALDRIVPDSMRSLKASKPIVVRSPSAVRPWQHVMEPLYGYLCLGRSLANSPGDFDSAWNFGPASSNVDVASLTEMIIKEWGSGKWIDTSNPLDRHEAHFLRLDSTKSYSLLGWQGILDVAEAVALSVEWYKAYYAEEDMSARTEDQISEYMEKVDLHSKGMG